MTVYEKMSDRNPAIVDIFEVCDHYVCIWGHVFVGWKRMFEKILHILFFRTADVGRGRWLFEQLFEQLVRQLF